MKGAEYNTVSSVHYHHTLVHDALLRYGTEDIKTSRLSCWIAILNLQVATIGSQPNIRVFFKDLNMYHIDEKEKEIHNWNEVILG